MKFKQNDPAHLLGAYTLLPGGSVNDVPEDFVLSPQHLGIVTFVPSIPIEPPRGSLVVQRLNYIDHPLVYMRSHIDGMWYLSNSGNRHTWAGLLAFDGTLSLLVEGEKIK